MRYIHSLKKKLSWRFLNNILIITLWMCFAISLELSLIGTGLLQTEYIGYKKYLWEAIKQVLSLPMSYLSNITALFEPVFLIILLFFIAIGLISISYRKLSVIISIVGLALYIYVALRYKALGTVSGAFNVVDYWIFLFPIFAPLSFIGSLGKDIRNPKILLLFVLLGVSIFLIHSFIHYKLFVDTGRYFAF